MCRVAGNPIFEGAESEHIMKRPPCSLTVVLTIFIVGAFLSITSAVFKKNCNPGVTDPFLSEAEQASQNKYLFPLSGP